MNVRSLKKALPHLIAIAVFLLVAVVYCRPTLEGKVLYQSDVLQYKGMAQQSVEYKEKYGHYPLWTESAFSGMPAYTIAMGPKTNFSTGILGTVLSLGMPKPISFFFLACICFYILLMVWRVNPWIGILGALAYAYCSYDPIIVVTGHETKMLAIAYAPGVIAGLLLLLRGKYLAGTALMTLFAAFQILSGHLQIVYYTLIAMGLLVLFYGIQSIRQGKTIPLLIGLVLAAVSELIGFGTSAVSSLPTQEYTRETMRGGRTELTHGTSKLESSNGLSKDYAFQWSYGIGETLTLAVPDIYGGGSGGKELGDDSKFADLLGQDFSVPEDQGVQYANSSAYWGAQPFTSGPVYVGAVICLLFIFGLTYVKGWTKWWLLSVAVVGIVLAWGKNFSALNYFLFDHLPFYNKFRAPAMALFLPQLAFPLLGALGLHELLTAPVDPAERWKRFRTTLYGAGALLAVLVVFYFVADYQTAHDTDLKERFMQAKMQQLSQTHQAGPDAQQQAVSTANALISALRSDRQSIYGGDLLRTIVLMVLAAALLGLYMRGKIKQPLILVAGLLLLSSYDLLSVGTRYLNRDNFVDASEFDSAISPTAADQQISNDPDKNFRVFDQSSQSPFEDSRASYFHNSIGGYSPAKLGLYQDLIDNQLSKGNMQVYDMLNTKYFIGRDPKTGQPVAQLNPGAFGPVWLVKGIDWVANGDQEMKALDSVDLRDTVVIQQRFASQIKTPPVADTTAHIHLQENLNDKLVYRVSARTPQFAVFSEIYYPEGWDAYIDGAKTDYLRVDYLLRGMSIPAGDHTIEFRFEPRSYARADTVAFGSNLAVYLLLLAAAIAEWRRNRPKRSNPA